MKKIIALIFALFLSIPFAQAQATAQTQTNTVSSEAEIVSLEVVKLYKQQKYEEALPFAQKAVALSLQEFGASHLKTASAYLNLGYVELGRGKKKNAIPAFESVAAIFDKNTILNKSESLIWANTLETLGYLEFEADKESSVVKLFAKALELREKFNGADAPETVKTLWALGNLNVTFGDNKQAADIYRRVYDIRLKKLGIGNFDTRDAMMRSKCSLLRDGEHDAAENLEAEFDRLDEANKPNSSQIIKTGIVNGKALKLEKPPYPQAARDNRAEGAVKVNVVIDETGKVVFACGAGNKVHLSLIQAAEWAAYESKFSPTRIDGKPVKLNGTIIYNFVGR